MKIDALGHVIRRHRVQKFAPAVERANARRAARLVTGKDQKIAAYLLPIKRHGSHALGGINERRHSEFPSPRGQLSHRAHHAQVVGDMDYDEGLYLRGKQ